MAKEPDSGKRLKTNPLISRLLEAQSENAIGLTGFIGPSTREGYIRLFLGLNDLSRSVEIAESDILATADIPKSELGAVAVWVRRGAQLHSQLSEKVEVAAAATQPGTFSDVRRAGLRMRVRAQARDTCTCEIICDGTHCVPCTCRCLARPQ